MSETDSVPEILMKWGLDAPIIQNFIDNDVTIKSLTVLSKDTIKLLIPKAGPRDLFEENLRIFKEGQVTQEATTSAVIITSPVFSPVTSPVVPIKDSDKHVQSKRKSQDPPGSNPPKFSRTVLSIKKDEPSINGLHEILKQTTEGVLLLCYYNNFQCFESKHRDELTTRAIFGELKNNYENRVSADRYLELAAEIEELFPTEDKDLYCHRAKEFRKRKSVPGQKKSQHTVTIVTGKLRPTFYNIRRKFIECGLISKSKLVQELASDEELDLETVDDDDDAILWLRAHDRPWIDVLQKWKLTSEVRNRLLKKPGDVSTYILGFPSLQSSIGYELLVNDFEEESPTSKDRISTHWPQWLAFLKAQLLKKAPKLFTDSPEDQHTALILLNVEEIFKVRNLPKQSKSKDVWKPTRAEVQQTFLLQIQEVSELDKIIETRQVVLKKFGFNFQPFPVIVGTLANIRQCLVIFEKQRWIVPTPLEAVDICYKINGALNTLYPPESRHIWLFIQRTVYELVTRSDFEGDPALRSFIAGHLKDFSLFVQKLR